MLSCIRVALVTALTVMTFASLARAEDKEQTLDATVVQAKEDAPAAATAPAATTSNVEKATTNATGSESTVCTNGKNKRLVQLTDNASACEVHYKKETEQAGHDQLIWSTTTQKATCAEKAQAFVDKLKAWGWSCTKA